MRQGTALLMVLCCLCLTSCSKKQEEPRLATAEEVTVLRKQTGLPDDLWQQMPMVWLRSDSTEAMLTARGDRVQELATLLRQNLPAKGWRGVTSKQVKDQYGNVTEVRASRPMDEALSIRMYCLRGPSTPPVTHLTIRLSRPRDGKK